MRNVRITEPFAYWPASCSRRDEPGLNRFGPVWTELRGAACCDARLIAFRILT